MTTPTPSIHRLRRGLPGYLILFAPHAFEPSASVTVQRIAFATGVLPNLYAFHRYTRNSILLSCTLDFQFEMQHPSWTRVFHISLKSPPTLPLRRKSGQRSPPTYYRGCWHVVSRGFLLRYRHYRP